MSISYEACGKKFKANYFAMKHNFENTKFKDFMGNYSAIEDKYKSLKDENKSSDSICASICSDLNGALFNKKISVDQCLSFIKKILEDFSELIDNSQLKKTACYAWYLKYEKNESEEN